MRTSIFATGVHSEQNDWFFKCTVCGRSIKAFLSLVKMSAKFHSLIGPLAIEILSQTSPCGIYGAQGVFPL